MPVPEVGHAATTIKSSHTIEMDSRGAASRLLEEPPLGPDKRIYSSANAPVTAGKTAPPETKELDKRSLDYVLRSGLAGGLAGCAVSSWNRLQQGEC